MAVWGIKCKPVGYWKAVWCDRVCRKLGFFSHTDLCSFFFRSLQWELLWWPYSSVVWVWSLTCESLGANQSTLCLTLIGGFSWTANRNCVFENGEVIIWVLWSSNHSTGLTKLQIVIAARYETMTSHPLWSRVLGNHVKREPNVPVPWRRTVSE